jgi:pimeloyl-ACP methyl ester carboxylesterase
MLLVHGAFSRATCWDRVAPGLRAAGHDVEAIDLPGQGDDPTPVAEVTLDRYAQRVCEALATGPPAVLVGHSMGGMVITQAAAGNDSVASLVYVGAFAPDHGESAFQLSTMFPGSTLGDALTAYPVTSGGNELAIRRDLYHQQFCADLPAEQAALMAATQRPATEAALTEGLPTETPAWRDIPSWFVYGDQDLNIPAALERFMADRAGAKDAREVAGASHALSVSAADAVTATILDAVAAR